MVSLSFNSDQGFCLLNQMNVPQLPPPNDSLISSTDPCVASFSDDSLKKIRKPYTITKSRESWTEQEHDKFLEALQLFDCDWKKIEAFVGSKTVVQIRSHAQKYFMKIQKGGTSEHVPPPRPKRKASHPYPHKASKHVQIISRDTGQYQQSTSDPYEADYSIPNATLSSWSFNSVPSVNVSQTTKDDVAGQSTTFNCCINSSDESAPRSWQTGVRRSNDGGNYTKPTKVPDFAKIYHFIGTVFEPNATGHLERLKQMDPVDLETVLYFMQNLSINLKSPEFENQVKWNLGC